MRRSRGDINMAGCMKTYHRDDAGPRVLQVPGDFVFKLASVRGTVVGCRMWMR